jgi:alginate O-acetyltransferase complex protein AlgJ
MVTTGAGAALGALSAEPARTFLAECAARAAAAEKQGAMAVDGKDGWLFLAAELRHLGVGRFWGPDAVRVSRATRRSHADPLPAILDFQAQLQKAKIALLLVPVPPKAVIYPDRLGAAVLPGRQDVYHQEFYRLLSARGVRVVDLVPEFRDHRAEREGPVYCRQDSHWSGRACVLAGRRIAREVRAQPWARQRAGSRGKFTHAWKKITLTGDLWQSAKGRVLPKESLLLRFVGTPSAAGPVPVDPDRASPVLLLGDSHNLIFHAGADMQAKGAGLADQLALELGFPVDLLAVRGSGATPARIALLRRARAEPDYLAGKKLVVWCFSAREFTESTGWQKVPVPSRPPSVSRR